VAGSIPALPACPVTERATQQAAAADGSGPPQDILVVLKSTATLRMLWPLLRALDARGHRVQIATKEVKTSETHAFAQRLVEECRGLRFTRMPYLVNGGWTEVARAVRVGLDYIRYLAPRYRDAPKLRARAEREVPPALRRLLRAARLGGPLGIAASRSALRAIERSLLPSPRAEEFLRRQEPDVLLIAPLVGFGSSQADLLRAARRLGIRSAYPVPSWDNLTNKGLIRDMPDLVLVWNELQAAEAVELHGVPRGSVCVTGAPAYDHWFDWKPSCERGRFCGEVGLDPDRPFILYAGSSAFIAPGEAAFFRRWLAALRARGGALADVGVLVRPHPLAASQWSEQDLDDPQVTVWPRGGEFPLGVGARQAYFDSIFHSAAVVGINTSALIESAIVGRPVHTVLEHDYRATQQGTIHFQYLVDDEFGHLRVARTPAEHAEQLERSLVEGDREALGERFVRRFIRPHGLETAATPLAVDAIEELAARPAPAPDHGPLLGSAVRLALSPAAAWAGRRRRLEKERRKPVAPLLEVKRVVRELARGRAGPVVAGPWSGSELDELLYWIPFLRWSATANLELADRLVAVARGDRVDWYGGVPARILPTDGPDASALRGDALDPCLIEPHLRELAGQNPWGPLHERILEFALLPAPELPLGMELPADFVATRFGADRPAAVIEAVAAWSPLVELDERAAEAAILARSRGFVGSDPVSAVLAVLTGIAAVLVGSDEAEDLRLARVLGRPPFGSLQVVEAERAADALREAAGALAEV
jgi:hypothetical protein